MQSSNSFWSECSFSSFVKFGSCSLPGPNSIVVYWCRVFNWVVWSMPEFTITFLSEIFKRLSRWIPCFRKVLHLLYFLFVNFQFRPARGSPASVKDHVMTSQIYIKVEHVMTWLLSSGVAKFQQFWSEGFFSSFVYFNSYCLRGPCSIDVFRIRACHWVFLMVENNVSVYFLSEILKLFSLLKPMFSEGPSFLVPLFVMMGLWVCASTW